MEHQDKRIVILCGAAGSGKTEFALQYSIMLAKQGKCVNIVDLDVINLFFRSRENCELLNKYGIKVYGSANFAFNNVDLPALSFAFQSLFEIENQYVVIDLGGTKDGLKLLRALSINGFDYDLWFVCNIYREDTNTVEKIINMVREFEEFSNLHITSLINNTNLAEETKIEDILKGHELQNLAAEKLGICIRYILADKKLNKGKKIFDIDVIAMDRIINRKEWMI